MKTKFPKSTQNIKPLVLKLKKELKALYGSNMQQMILFGSYARGTIHEESDLDLLLLLKEMESPYHENVFMNELVTDFSFENEIYFSVLATTVQKFKNIYHPLYKNVKREGIII